MMVALAVDSRWAFYAGLGERGVEQVVAKSVLQRVAAGEMAAMQECIDEYGGLIWSLARRFCSSPAEAEDAAQEVFIALWENAARFDEAKGAEVTFVAMIARRRLIDSGRKQQRRRNAVDRAKELKRPEAAAFDYFASGREPVNSLPKQVERAADATAGWPAPVFRIQAGPPGLEQLGLRQ